VSVILVTGASGFLGALISARLELDGHVVIRLSRNPGTDRSRTITGDFSSIDSLRQLDGVAIDTVIHLGGVTGDTDEEDAISVNVAGTRRLLRHFIDRGVRHFIVASSIAATGCLSSEFIPRTLPIPDDHPFDSRNVYGLSKYLMEEVANYFARVEPSIEITLFRIGGAYPGGTPAITVEALQSELKPFNALGAIAAEDVAAAFSVAASRRRSPGARRVNLVAPIARTALPTAQTLRLLLGDRISQLDLSYFDAPGNEYAGIYSVERLATDFGFVARTDVRTMKTPNAATEKASDKSAAIGKERHT
jgi:nucleoside-diphosphate-sugar epimerase